MKKQIQIADGARVKRLGQISPFEKYRGIGNPGMLSGRKTICFGSVVK